LASIGWSLGVIALVLKSGLLSPPVVPQTLSQDPLSLSIAVLKQTESFKAAAVGVAGSTPNEVLAWRVIFNSPNRESIFRDVLVSGSPSGRLYALAGLWFEDANAFVGIGNVVKRECRENKVEGVGFEPAEIAFVDHLIPSVRVGFLGQFDHTGRNIDADCTES